MLLTNCVGFTGTREEVNGIRRYTYIIVWIRYHGISLDNEVDKSVDDSEGVKVEVVSIFLFYLAVGDLVVLLLEETEKARTIMAGRGDVKPKKKT